MLGTAQADALGATVDCVTGVVGVVSVGAHMQATALVSVTHQAVHASNQLAGVGVLSAVEGLVQAATQVGHNRGVNYRNLT